MAVTIEKDKDVTTTVEQQETFDIVETKNEIVSKYKGSPEVDALTTEIVVDDSNSIVKFGSKVADEVSKASDTVLSSMNMGQLNDTGKVLTSLNKIMEEFDIKELEEDPKGIKKIFTNLKKQVDKILTKYDTMGKEIDKIYVQLKQYESEIQRSNEQLETMFQVNVENYHKLELYILAGEQGVEEIANLIADAEKRAKTDANAQFEVQTYQQAKQLLELRVQDLRVAEQVAMQSVPMLKTMEYSNLNLVRKIDSAFIITLPVFKQAIAQAVLLKRQKIQADSLAKLDETTNELLKRNAKNTAQASADIMRMTSQSSIKIETLQETYNTIMNGIKETQRIQEESSKKREEDKLKLEQMKTEFNNTYKLPDGTNKQ